MVYGGGLAHVMSWVWGAWQGKSPLYLSTHNTRGPTKEGELS